jgi:hypothetical protein
LFSADGPFTVWQILRILVLTFGQGGLRGGGGSGPGSRRGIPVCAASRTTSVIVNPLASIVIGVTAFGERLRPGAAFAALDVLALTVMCAGVVVLIRSPLVGGLSGTRSEEYLGAGDRSGLPVQMPPCDG